MGAIESEEVSLAQQGKIRKASKQRHYDNEIRTAISKHAIKYGNRSAVDKFSAGLGFALPEAMVRNFKCELKKLVTGGKVFDKAHIEARKRGCRLLPEQIDFLTKRFIQSLRLSGSPVSSSIVIAIVIHQDQSLLKECGGPEEVLDLLIV